MTEHNEADASAPPASNAPFDPFESPFGPPLVESPSTDEPAPPEAEDAGSDELSVEPPPDDDQPGRAPRSGRGLLRRLAPMLAFAATVALVGWVVYSGVEGLLQSNSLEARIAETQEEIAALQCEADQLAAMVAWLESDEYVERTAREDLGLVRPAEEAFAVHAPPREGLSIVRSPWWANLLHESACA